MPLPCGENLYFAPERRGGTIRDTFVGSSMTFRRVQSLSRKHALGTTVRRYDGGYTDERRGLHA